MFKSTERLKGSGETDSGYTISGARGNATSKGVNRNVGTNTANKAKKMLLAQALEAGVVLDEKQMAFLANDGERVVTGQETQELTTIAIFQIDDLDAFDSDYDEAPSTSAVFVAKLSAYDSDVLLEVPNHDTYLDNNVIDQSVQEMQYFEQPSFINDSDIDIQVTPSPCVVSRVLHVVAPIPADTIHQLPLIKMDLLLRGNIFEIEKKELFIENDRLLEYIICQDLMYIAMHADLDSKCGVPAHDD
ncbi:hypothetical protein Tco_0419343 [Tanacetum coccineum]